MWIFCVNQKRRDCHMQTLLNPTAPTSSISSVFTVVITNFLRYSLHGRSWRLQNRWGRRRRLMQTCSMVVEFCSMGASRDRRYTMDSEGVFTHNRWWLTIIVTVDNIYNPWLFCQKSCVVSLMQWYSFTFLEMKQDPHWLLFLPYLHLFAWDQGGMGGVAC